MCETMQTAVNSVINWSFFSITLYCNKLSLVWDIASLQRIRGIALYALYIYSRITY